MLPNAAAPAEPVFSQTGSRFDFTGTGGEMLGRLLVGALLCIVTLGLYVPWFLTGMYRYVYSRTRLRTTAGDSVGLEFTGSGGRFFAVAFIGYLLTLVTAGIYGAWFIAGLIRFFLDNSCATDSRGARWRLQYTGTGGALFGVLFVGVLLTVVTLGVYAPWAICRVYQHVAARTRVLRDDVVAGQVEFLGRGGDLFVTFVVGALLTVVTLGIYGFWFQVKLTKFMAACTRVTIDGDTYAGDFVGLGSDLLVINLVGNVLTVVTLGIYVFWFITATIRFNYNNYVFRRVPAGG